MTAIKFNSFNLSSAARAGEYLAYPMHAPIALCAEDGTPVPRGYLYLAEISPIKTASEDDMPAVRLALYAATFSERANTFVRSAPRISVIVPAPQFRAAFGRRFPTATLPNGLLKKTMKELFARAGRAKDFPDVDYDKAFKAIAGKMFSKFPGGAASLDDADRDDLILDTFLQVVTTKTIKDYDATRDPISYFGGMFQLRMTNELKALVTQRVREVKNPNKDDNDLTDEEFFDMVDHRQKVNPVTDEIDYRELIRELLNHLRSKPEGKYFVPMFNLLAQGYSNKEVAEELKVSPAIISRYLERMKQAILEYARHTGNQLLYALMSEYLGKRKHAQDAFDPIVDVLKQYKKRVTGRAYAGKLTTVERTSIPNKATVDYAAAIALDIEQPDLADDLLTQHFSELLEQDELVDRDPGTIVGLSIRKPL